MLLGTVFRECCWLQCSETRGILSTVFREEKSVGYRVQGGEECWVQCSGRRRVLGTVFREERSVVYSVQGGEKCWVRERRGMLGK